MRERHFDGTRLEPRNLLENAQTPTTMAPAYFAGDRVHAVLGVSLFHATMPLYNLIIKNAK